MPPRQADGTAQWSDADRAAAVRDVEKNLQRVAQVRLGIFEHAAPRDPPRRGAPGGAPCIPLGGPVRSRPGFAAEEARDFRSWQYATAPGPDRMERLREIGDGMPERDEEEPRGGVKGAFDQSCDDVASRRSSNGAAPGGIGRRLRCPAPDPYDPHRQAMLQNMIRAAATKNERPSATASASAADTRSLANAAGDSGAQRRLSHDADVRDTAVLTPPQASLDLAPSEDLGERVSRKAHFATLADLGPEVAPALATSGAYPANPLCPGGTSAGTPTARQQLPCRRWHACAPFAQNDACGVAVDNTRKAPSTALASAGHAGESAEAAGRPPPVRSWRTRRR